MINATEITEIIHSTQKRKRWTAYEKQQIVSKTYHPCVSLSFIVRRHGLSPSQLFQWRKLMETGDLIAISDNDARCSVAN